MDGLRHLRHAAWLLALALALALGNASAQETPAGPTDPPDPAALSVDWWGYFQKAEGAIGERIDTFQTRLDALRETITGDDERSVRLEALITEIQDLATRYRSVVARKPPDGAPTPATPETFTIDALLALSAQEREATFEANFEVEEVARTVRTLEQAHKDIEDAKARYFALAPAAPERLESGLAIIRARFLHAINTVDLELRRVHAAALQKRAAYLVDALKQARTRLAVTEANEKEWSNRLVRARAEGQRLEAESSSTRLRVSSFGDAPDERAKRRRIEQQLVDFEVRISAARIAAAEAALAAEVAAQIHSPDPKRLEVLRTERDALSQQLGTARNAIETWRRATDRERTAAMTQLADVAGADAGLAEIHRSRITRTDETSQQLNALERRIAQARTLIEVADLRIVEDGGLSADLWARSRGSVAAVWEWSTTWGGKSLFSISETPVTPAGLVRVVLILTVAWWASRLLRHGLERVMERRDTMSRASLYTLGRLSHYVILVVALMVALSSIGLDFTKLALFVSALGVGLGFGLQAIFSNFVAGLIILFEKSLKVGDFVELESGVHGEVREINIRGTLITTNDNIDILVPNAEFVSGRVTNWTLREAFRRVRVPFGVAYGTDKDLVRKAGLEAADEVPFTLKTVAGRQPQVWLVGFGDSSLDFELVVWLTQEAVKRPSAVNAAYNWALESALGRHGIEIPFPQRDLNVRSFFGRKDADGLETVHALRGAGEPLPDAVP